MLLIEWILIHNKQLAKIIFFIFIFKLLKNLLPIYI